MWRILAADESWIASPGALGEGISPSHPQSGAERGKTDTLILYNIYILVDVQP